MRLYSRSTVSIGVLCLLESISFALWIPPESLDQDLLSSYDYVIIGGGISGLVVANSLTENPDSMQISLLPLNCFSVLTNIC